MISEEPAELQATIEQTDSGEQQYVLRALCDHLSSLFKGDESWIKVKKDFNPGFIFYLTQL